MKFKDDIQRATIIILDANLPPPALEATCKCKSLSLFLTVLEKLITSPWSVTKALQAAKQYLLFETALTLVISLTSCLVPLFGLM